MEYIKIRFGKNLGQMHSRLQKTIDDMFQQVRPVLVLQEQAWRPQMDIYETPTAIVVLADVSGVENEALEVEADSRTVRIAGARKVPEASQTARYHLAEIAYGRFERILSLPGAIDSEKGEASYINGMLRIVLPRQPEVRRISIESQAQD